jgi:uncharacterized delta-60 repeat protein
VTSYEIARSSNAGSTWTTVTTLTAPATSYTATNLTNGTPYQFRVIADNGVTGEPAVVSVTPATTPGTPSNVVGANSGASVIVSWIAPVSTGGSPLTDYTVQYSNDGGSTWATLSRPASTTRSATLTELVTGTSYAFRVAAVNAVGESVFSTQSLPVVAKSRPGAPTSVSGTPGASSVFLTWGLPIDTGGYAISNYVIERSADNGATWVKVVRSVSTVRSATVSGLTNGTAYVFRVVAVNTAGTGEFSVISDPVTPRTIPAAIRTLTSAAGHTSVVLSWLAPLSDGGSPITDYLIQYSTNSGQTWVPVADGVSTELSAKINDLTNGTAYLFRVAASTSGGSSPWTNAAPVTPRTVPDAPASVTATPGISRVTLTWTTPPSNGGATVTDYVIEFSSDAGTTWYTASDPVSAALSGSILSLTPGTSYIVRVAAKNVAGTGEFSSPSSPATPFGVPGVVTNATSAAGNAHVVLSWDAPDFDGAAVITDYVIEFSTNNSTWTKVSKAVSTTTSHTVTGLTNRTQYFFRVAAVNAAGTGERMSAPPATPLPDPTAPTAPTALTATAGDASVNLSWAAPSSDGGAVITDYVIEVSANNGAWQPFTDGVSSATSATVTGLTHGTNYRFRVAASNAIGTSSFSTASASITPLVPMTITYGSGLLPVTGTAQSITPTIANSTGTNSFSYSGTLPDGVSFDPATGVFATTGLAGVSTGGLDPNFVTQPAGTLANAGANNTVNAIAVQPDGKMIIGGEFTTYNGTSSNRIARLNADGSLDTTFDPGSGANGPIRTIAVQADGKIVIGGDFPAYNGTTRNGIARLNADGSLDTSFNPGTGTNNTVAKVQLQSDNKILIVGLFTSYNGTSRNFIARLNTNGSLDSSFNPGSGANTSVMTVAVQSDGKILIGGWFSSYNGTSRNRIARLNTDGSLDASFTPGTGADNGVNALGVQSDDKILVGGFFTTINGVAQRGVVRLNTDGSRDTGFDTGSSLDGRASSIAIHSTGKIIIGGEFTAYNGTSRNRIARLNADGSLDGNFGAGQASSNDSVMATAVQSDGKIVIGGNFTNYHGKARNRVARLNADGTLDTSFNPGTGASGTVKR